MHKATIFPLGNADTTCIDLEGGRKILVDYADMRDPNDKSDKRIDLPKALRSDLNAADRDYYDVVAFTHIDTDHIKGSSGFFYLEHATKYQGEDRIHIHELWVPAAAILESGCTDESKIIRAEARYRLKQGKGIRVFSSPGLLDEWLKGEGIDPAVRRDIIHDAGTVVPGFTLGTDGVEFFVHSPFASRSEGKLIERNRDALALQATFLSGGRYTRMHLFADIPYDVIEQIVSTTEYHARRDESRYDRLKWDIFHLPHHSSYLSLGPEKGKDETVPVPLVKKLYETYGQPGAKLISTSDPIPTVDTNQPPHRQAAAYYKRVARKHGGEYLVTMDHPSRNAPKPLVVQIDSRGATVKKEIAGGVGPIVSGPARRAGGR